MQTDTKKELLNTLKEASSVLKEVTTYSPQISDTIVINVSELKAIVNGNSK